MFKRLGKDKYKRPKLTLQDKLDEEEIEDKLDDYVEVENIGQVALGTHMRYFTKVKGKKKFRLGGILINNSGLPKYVVLTNGKLSWSVQVKDTTFFRKMTVEEIKEEYEEIIEEFEAEINKLKEQKSDLLDVIKKLKR